uniref:Sushi domain-containing protein n=1 Tax=Oncorhynchus tshawytscha TaxID=74940 RepID=A0A8C8FQW5_ONCTS
MCTTAKDLHHYTERFVVYKRTYLGLFGAFVPCFFKAPILHNEDEEVICCLGAIPKGSYVLLEQRRPPGYEARFSGEPQQSHQDEEHSCHHLWVATAQKKQHTGLLCVSVLPPRRGSFYVERGTGVSVGTVLAFWCREGYQLVGSDKISCSVRAGKPQWSNFLPVCEAIPRPEDRGLRVAVLASVVSGIVILAMSLSFIICCLQERTGKDRGSRRDGRIRRRDTRSSRRSECWLEREEGDWDTFPPPKIFHLSQRPDLRLAAESPVYLGGMAGFDNRGYQRSQESLLKATLPGLFRTESQIIYPHVVLQRVPTPTAPTAPTAPVYLHNMPSNSASNSGCAPTQPHHMPPYPTPQYPIHNSTPQRVPWQMQPH